MAEGTSEPTQAPFADLERLDLATRRGLATYK